MCGRTRCTLRAQDVPRACGFNNGGPIRTVQMDRYRPSFNVSPGFYVPVVSRQAGSDETVVHCMKWGLIPSFTKKTEKPDHYRMFNARSESISEKASFRRLIPNNRCVVAVEGFYEWKKDGSKKQPYYIHFKDDRPLVFAALYDSWKDSEGETLYSFTILTTSCSSALQWLHDRMPVILGCKSSIDAWLNGSPPSTFSTVLTPYEGADLVWYPVTPAMGKSSFDGPECVKQIQLKAEDKNQILKFFSKKRVDEDPELKEQTNSSLQEFASTTDQCKSLKEEERNTDQLSTESGQKENITSDVSSLEIESLKEEEGNADNRSVDSKPKENLKFDVSTIETKSLKQEERNYCQLSTDSKESKQKEILTSDVSSVEIKSLKEEERNTTRLSTDSDVNEKATSDVSPIHLGDTRKCGVKRDHGGLASDKRASGKETGKLDKSSGKKRGNIKNAGDKQPTLFSYFGRK